MGRSSSINLSFLQVKALSFYTSAVVLVIFEAFSRLLSARRHYSSYSRSDSSGSLQSIFADGRHNMDLGSVLSSINYLLEYQGGLPRRTSGLKNEE